MNWFHVVLGPGACCAHSDLWLSGCPTRPLKRGVVCYGKLPWTPNFAHGHAFAQRCHSSCAFEGATHCSASTALLRIGPRVLVASLHACMLACFSHEHNLGIAVVMGSASSYRAYKAYHCGPGQLRHTFCCVMVHFGGQAWLIGTYACVCWQSP